MAHYGTFQCCERADGGVISDGNYLLHVPRAHCKVCMLAYVIINSIQVLVNSHLLCYVHLYVDRHVFSLLSTSY